MKDHTWEQQYEELISKQEKCLRANNAQLKKLECCFLASFNASHLLLKDVLKRGFASTRERVFFFKNIKPKFLSHALFYRLLYQLTLFEPVEDVQQRREYWLKEKNRLTKYANENRDFYLYWKKGGEENDEDYFGSCEIGSELIEAANIAGMLYETKGSAAVEFDNQVAVFMALERFSDYVSGKLKELAISSEM